MANFLLCFYWILPVMKETTGQSYINMIWALFGTRREVHVFCIVCWKNNWQTWYGRDCDAQCGSVFDISIYFGWIHVSWRYCFIQLHESENYLVRFSCGTWKFHHIETIPSIFNAVSIVLNFKKHIGHRILKLLAEIQHITLTTIINCVAIIQKPFNRIETAAIHLQL